MTNNYYYVLSEEDDTYNIIQSIHDIQEINGYCFNWHPSIELSIALQGEVQFIIGGQKICLKEDDLILINPNEEHMLAWLGAGNIAMTIRMPIAYSAWKKLSFNCNSGQTNRYLAPFNEIRRAAALMLRAFQNTKASVRRCKVLTAYYTLMDIFISNFCKTESYENQHHEGDHADSSINKVLAYLEENYMHKISLDDIATLLQYNRTYCSSFFKHKLGINFYDYLNRLRFRRALHDVSASSRSLTEIASEHGFPNLKSFNSYFKRILSQTPSQYRNGIQRYGKINLADREREYLPQNTPAIEKKLDEYLTTDYPVNTNSIHTAQLMAKIKELENACRDIENLLSNTPLFLHSLN